MAKTSTLSEDTRSRLLEAAQIEFTARGYQKASLRSICSRAELTTGALYFFFKNKDELFKVVADDFTGRLDELFVDLVKSEVAYLCDGGDAASDAGLERVDAAAALFEEHAELASMLEKSRNADQVIEMFEGAVTHAVNAVRAVLDECGRGHGKRGVLSDQALRQYCWLQLDALFTCLSNSTEADDVRRHYASMLQFMRGGFAVLLELDAQTS